MLAGLTFAIAAAAALVPGTQVAGTGECPPPPEVERRLPPLSSAIRVQVEPSRGGVRVRVLDRSGKVLDDASLAGETCEALAELAARHVEAWAAAHGALRAEGALPLPPPPMVELSEPAPPPPSVEAAEPPGPDLPLRLGGGVGAGALVDGMGVAAGFDLWGLAGPGRAPFWGEASVSLTPTRSLQVGQFPFLWRRGLAVTVGGAYRLSRAPIQAVAGFQGAQLQARPVGPFDSRAFDAFDAGAYAGLRALLSLGPLTGWVGARLSGWFVEHRIEVGDPADGNAASVPFLGVWFGLGVLTGDAP